MSDSPEQSNVDKDPAAQTAEDSSSERTIHTPPPQGKAKGKPGEPPRGFFGKLWHEWVKPLGTVILIVTVVRSSLFDWNDVPSGSMRPTILEGDRIVVNKLAYGFNLPFNGPVVDLPLLPAFDNPLDFLPGFQWSGPERGDIVTFWNPTPDWRPSPNGQRVPNESTGIRMVKRVVGLPGDTVRVVDGKLEITGADGNPVSITYQDVVDGPYPDEPTMAVRVNRNTGQVFGEQRKLPVAFMLECFGDEPHFVQLLQAYGEWAPSGQRYRTIPAAGSDTPAITLADRDGWKNDEYLMIGDNRDNSLDSRYYWQDYGDTANSEPVFVRGEHITGKAKFVAVSFDGGSFLSPAWGRFFRSFDGEAQDVAESP
ncbi:MAG: signal peptidase I [Planctomycetota bacterium]